MMPSLSEALFGSAARRDGDRLSDVDYLIVGDDVAELKRRKDWLGAQGFSVSDFTWSRLERMCTKQTLFSLHLKLESKLTFDGSGRLRELLGSCTAKSNYNYDFQDSLKLFQPLECVPPCPKGVDWAMDVLAVAFRNSVILSLAHDGDFLFSMNSILRKLVERGRVGREQASALGQLRGYKAAYRSGIKIGAGIAQLQEMLRAVSGALAVDLQCGIAAHSAQFSSKNTINSTDAYSRMRMVEGELISIPESALRTQRLFDLHRSLLRVVRNPHGYLWSFMYPPAQLDQKLNELRAFL